MQVGEKSYAQGDKNENVETNRLIGTKYTKSWNAQGKA